MKDEKEISSAAIHPSAFILHPLPRLTARTPFVSLTFSEGK
jgi:hypothetical protein